jgi:hypothetical protein
MKEQLARALQGITMAALLAAGFTLGIHVIDVRTYAISDRSCVPANGPGRAGVDPRAVVAFLQMCR